MIRSNLYPRHRAHPRHSGPTPARHRSHSRRSTAHQRHPEAPRLPLRAPLCHPRGSPPRYSKTAGQRHRRPASPHRRATRIIRLRSTPNRPAHGKTFGNTTRTRAGYTHKENDQWRCLAAIERPGPIDSTISPATEPDQRIGVLVESGQTPDSVPGIVQPVATSPSAFCELRLSDRCTKLSGWLKPRCRICRWSCPRT